MLAEGHQPPPPKLKKARSDSWPWEILPHDSILKLELSLLLCRGSPASSSELGIVTCPCHPWLSHRSVERAAAASWQSRNWLCLEDEKQPLHMSLEGFGNQWATPQFHSHYHPWLKSAHWSSQGFVTPQEHQNTMAFQGEDEGKDLWPGNGPSKVEPRLHECFLGLLYPG